MSRKQVYSVVDLFSGAGGMSYGIYGHPNFQIVAATDAEVGKPRMAQGSLRCNKTYAKNMGISPRNSLVRKAALFAVALDADGVVMENTREWHCGNFKDHYDEFRKFQEANGYKVSGRSWMLSTFGLPQIRERVIMIAVKEEIPLRTLDCLWDAWTVNRKRTVESAFSAIPAKAAARDACPAFYSGSQVAERLAAIPSDGGAWMNQKKSSALLADAMKRIIRLKKRGSHPDVYGRMARNRPAPTIKRECALSLRENSTT